MNNGRLKYRESLPAPALREWIRCYYFLESPPEMGRTCEGFLVPDGHLEVGFNLGGARSDLVDGRWLPRPRNCVDEVLYAARYVRWQAPIRFIGIKFRYEAGLGLLALRPRDVRERPLELSTLSVAGLAALEEQIDSAGTLAAVITCLDRFFLARLSAGSPDALVAGAAARIRSSVGSLPIARVSSSLGVSRRTLELRVKERTGLTPKRIAQVVRTREAIRRVCDDPQQRLGRLATGLGFCDQSHFIREFKATAGRSPAEFFTENQFVADFCDRSISSSG